MIHNDLTMPHSLSLPTLVFLPCWVPRIYHPSSIIHVTIHKLLARSAPRLGHSRWTDATTTSKMLQDISQFENQGHNCRVQCVFFLDSSVQSGYLSNTGTEPMTTGLFHAMVPFVRSLATRCPFWPSPSLPQFPCSNVLLRARAFCSMPCRPNQKSITCGVARPRSRALRIV